MQTQPWDYFQFVDIGVDRVQHGFWKDHDPLHVLHDPGSPFRDTIHQYYRHLDEEIGRVLELLSDETIVLVVSDHGAQRLDVGFCVNEWLVREGLLVLNRYPEAITPFAELDVNWDKTRAWSEGGDCRADFLERQGTRTPGSHRPGRRRSVPRRAQGATGGHQPTQPGSPWARWRSSRRRPISMSATSLPT